YILRAYSPSVTIAGGVILDPAPPRAAIRTAAALDRMRRLERDPAGAMIAERGALGLPMRALITRAGVDPRAIDERIAALLKSSEAVLAGDADASPAVADRMLKLLQRQKVLVRVDTLLFHDQALKQLKAEVAALKTAAGPAARIDVATFKERFGVTRKFAIPLLEYLDRE